MLEVGMKVLVTGYVLPGIMGKIVGIKEGRGSTQMPYVVEFGVGNTVGFKAEELTPIPEGATEDQIQALRKIVL